MPLKCEKARKIKACPYIILQKAWFVKENYVNTRKQKRRNKIMLKETIYNGIIEWMFGGF